MLNAPLDFDQGLTGHIRSLQLETVGQFGLAHAPQLPDPADICPNVNGVLLNLLLVQFITPGLVLVLLLYFMELG